MIDLLYCGLHPGGPVAKGEADLKGRGKLSIAETRLEFCTMWRS